jgi:hypothetical protein
MAKRNGTQRLAWPAWSWWALIGVVASSILTIFVTIYTAN